MVSFPFIPNIIIPPVSLGTRAHQLGKLVPGELSLPSRTSVSLLRSSCAPHIANHSSSSSRSNVPDCLGQSGQCLSVASNNSSSPLDPVGSNTSPRLCLTAIPFPLRSLFFFSNSLSLVE
eukprot:TRINITY_DN24658_c0_g1_i1.p1 TRINITY_DN24658_c0_g1~~TRINITY_DN24658_c0_g1_i1.p1  ORF type:complete len:120 (-),score=5.93 TRINITY_DN24658_c0_g1_i1:31-390(-)